MSSKQHSTFSSPQKNPCLEESKLSQQCLEKNLYDYSKCSAYFENYNQCKKFWGLIASKRKQAGMSPQIPTEEERKKIFDKWKKEKKIILEG